MQLIKEKYSMRPEGETEYSSPLREFIEKHLMKSFSEKEKYIARRRHKDVFGIGENFKTTQELAEKYGCSKGKITYIINKAYRKASHAIIVADQKMKDPLIIIKDTTGKNLNLPMVPKQIWDLAELSVRTTNCLHNAKLTLLIDILEKTPRELMQIPNFGKVCLKELRTVLAEHGLSLREIAS